MKDRPITMTARAVRAILAGEKTQFRRPFKPQPVRAALVSLNAGGLDVGDHWIFGRGSWELDDVPDAENPLMRAPWRRGQRLWVRERWESGSGLALRRPEDAVVATGRRASTIIYAADGVALPEPLKWRPAKTMERTASRATLLVTSVCAHRVAGTTDDGARAEGFSWKPTANSERVQFYEAWDRQWSKRGFGIADNPWVWAVTFRVLEDGE